METGVLLMAYGSPATQEQIPAYLQHIRGGQPPSAAAVADLTARYAAIGGGSPLADITFAQAAALQNRLDQIGKGYRVYVGMRHAEPFIADTVAQMRQDGIQRAIAIAMAPHYAKMAAGAYFAAALGAIQQQKAGISLQVVESWHVHPLFIAALGQRVREALRGLPGKGRQSVVFTAHSLPERIVAEGDPYLRQLQETCAAVASEAGIASYQLALQSAGRSPEPWLGPTVNQALISLHTQGVCELVVCPVGFVADHLEILYDIDIVLSRQAADLGMAMVRTTSFNDDPALIAVLADLVQQAETA